MPAKRVILDPAGSAESTFSDPNTSLSRAELSARVAEVAALLDSHAPMRLCLPLSSDVASMAVLIAALESAHSVALIPAGDDSIIPGFAGGVLRADAAAGAALALTGAPQVADAEDRIYLRTSGSTGTPKWAAHATDRLLANGQGVVTRLELTAADRTMLPVPMHHMYGLGAGLLPSLLVGASIHVVPRGNPLTVFQAQRGFKPSTLFLVPSQCRSIMALGRKAGAVRLVVVAGDKLGADEAAAFETGHGRLVNLYGATELGAITAGRPSDPPDVRHPFAGPPIDGFELALLPVEDPDAADGAEVFRVKHAHGLLGYAFPDTGEIREKAGSFWTTSDLVRRHDDDIVEVLGRADHAVNRDGLLVHMSDVEACLAAQPGVAQTAVVSAGKTRRGAGLTAFVASGDSTPSDAASLLSACQKTLPPRAVPDQIVVLPALPLLPSGKFDRRALTAEAEARLTPQD